MAWYLGAASQVLGGEMYTMVKWGVLVGHLQFHNMFFA